MKKFVLLTMSILVMFVLSACQPTPEQSIVKEKSLDNMVEEATKTQPGSGGVQGATLAEKIGAEKTYVKEFKDSKGKVSIHVNADVLVPDTSSVTVQRVEQEKITQAQVDILLAHMMKGDLFSGNDYKMTKSEVQSELQKVQDAISARRAETSDKAALKEVDRASFMLIIELAQLQEDLITAPDTTKKIPSNGKLGPMNKDMGVGEELYVLSQPADGGYQSLHVYNYSDGISMVDFTCEKSAFSKNNPHFVTKEAVDAASRDGLHSYITPQEINEIPDISITKEDAKKKADDLVTALGLQGFTCYSQDKEYGGSMDKTPDQSAYINPPKCVWFLRYARAVNGIPATYTVWDCMKVEENYQSAPWSYEDMTIAIDDSGTVYFSWNSPYKVTGTVTENANVLPFKDAMNVFDTMALVVNAWEGYADGNTNLKGIDIKVDQIRFGLTRITEQNKRDSGLLVPCWDFFGIVTYISEKNGQTTTMDDGPIPILTINAIDGSIINRSLGY